MTFASLQSQRILITGSSSGIGHAMALECAKAGADVILNCRSSIDRARSVADEIRNLGVSVQVIQADVSLDADRQHLFDECFASGRVDALISNAGADLLTTELRAAPFSIRMQKLFETDVVGTVELSRLFGRAFYDQQRGSILSIGWDQSDRGMEGDSGELFAMAKNAVMGFTRSIALSFAPFVRVNCIAPGWIRTAWGATASDYWQERVLSETPLKRWGEPSDIAKMARFLLSEEASFVTGQVINVNGGAVR